MRTLNSIVIAFVFLLAGSVAAEEAAELEAEGIDALKLSMNESDAVVAAAIYFGKAADAYDQAHDSIKATEMNSFLYWCKKKMTLQQMDAFLKGGDASSVAIAKRMAAIERAAPAPNEAREYFQRAEAYSRQRPEEHLLIAVRFFEIADRFKGEEFGLQAMDRSLKEMQQITGQPAHGHLPAKPFDAKELNVELSRQAKRNEDLKSVNELARNVKGPGDAKQVFGAVLALCDDAIANDDFSVAENASNTARSLAEALKDMALAGQVRDRQAQVTTLKAEFGRIQKSIETLKVNPDDPKANMAVGKYICFLKEQWRKGLPFLAKGNDPVLQTAAEADIAGSKDSQKWSTLGDGWWDQGVKLTGLSRRNVLHRSVGFYLRAVPSLDGIAKLRIEKRVGDYFKNDLTEIFAFNPIIESSAKSEQAGGSHDNEVRCPEFGFVIGLKVCMGGYEGRPNIRGFQPIFLTRKGPVTGVHVGGIDGNKEYMAKPGYALSGIIVAKGVHRFTGFKLTFQRVNGISLDPNDSYDSAWIGDHKETDTLTTLQSSGKLVIGFTGAGGADLDIFGLTYLKSYKLDGD